MSASFSWPEWGQWLIYLHFGNESSLSAPLPAFSTAWTTPCKLLFSMKVISNSTFTVVQTTHELSNIIAWRLIIIKLFVFSHSGRYLLYPVPLQNRNHLCSQELMLCTLLGSLIPRHNVHYLPALECTCGVWELQTDWTAVLSVTHRTCQVKTDKRFSSHLLMCNKTTY